MTTLADEVYRATLMGNNDGQATHYGKTATESLQDAELRFVNFQLNTKRGNIADAWFQLAFEQLYQGAKDVNSIKLEYWMTVPTP